MREEALLEMSAEDIERYGRIIGVDVSGKRTKRQKADAIAEARARTATVCVLGLPCEVPIRRMHDKRVTDLLAKRARTDEDYMAVMRAALGDDQYASVMERATDEDGTVDNDALGLAYTQIVESDELKNYSSSRA